MAHHFGRARRPMKLTDPNDCSQGNGKDASGQSGGRGNSAINRGALHQGPNDPQVFLPAIAPITGPRKSPSNPKNNPMSAPATPPISPHFVAPKRFAPT